MVVLGGLKFLMSEVPLYEAVGQPGRARLGMTLEPLDVAGLAGLRPNSLGQLL